MPLETRILRKNIGFEKIKNGKLKEILRKKINKIEFKEIKNSILGMLYMVCEFSLDGKLLARGVSIRSLLDGFNRKRGKNKAFGRAVKALLSKSNSEPLREYIDEDTVLRRSFTSKNEKDSAEFLKIVPYLESSTSRNGKYEYRVNPLLPLLLAKRDKIVVKSEFNPSSLTFRGMYEI